MRLQVVTFTCDRSETAIYQGLARAGIEIDIICSPRAPARAALEESGLRLSFLDVRHRLDLRAARQLRRKLLRDRPDVLYAPRNSTLSVSLMAARRTPVRCVGYRGTVGHLSRWDPASLITYFHPRLAGIVCVSEAVRRYLADVGIPDSRTVTIYKGHDPAWYADPVPADLARLGIPDDAFVVAFAGNIRPVKGVDVLVRALARLAPDSRVHLLLIGQVRDKRVPKLVSQAGLEQRVHFTGFRKDTIQLVAASDAFVMPSIEREGLPRAVIEAMSLGRPVVVSDAGGLPELVQDGESGLLVPARDAAALADAIERVASDSGLRTRLAEGGRRRVESAFHVRDSVRRMMELLQSLVADAPPAT